MNSAVEPLLKAINDLKNKVGELEMKVVYLEGEVSRLRDEMHYELHSSTPNTTSIPYGEYTWSSYTRETPTPYGEPVTPTGIADIRMENGNLLLTYSDGTTQTVNPVL